MPDINGKKDLYNTQQLTINRLKKVAQDESLLPEHRQLIQEYDEEIKARGGHSKWRMKFAFCLPVLLRQLDKPMNQTTQKDLKKLVAWIEDGGDRGWSETTKNEYRRFLKAVWKYANGYDPRERPKEVLFIRVKTKPTPPDWLPDDELVEKAINCCFNARDKFIISALYEGGFRTGELLHLKLGDWRMDGSLIEVHVPKEGKTGERIVYMHDVIPYYKQWLAEHPDPLNEGAPLLVNRYGKNVNGRMKAWAVLKVVKHAFARAGTPRNVNIQLLRKRNCTEMAGKLPGEQLNARQGWVQGSQMAAFYVKFNKKRLKKAAKQMYGIQDEDTRAKPRALKCINPSCAEMNPSSQRFCYKCHTPLTLDAAQDVRRVREQIVADQKLFYETGDMTKVLAKIEARLEALEVKQ